MDKQIVFSSYDYDNDRHYKNLLLAWDQNKEIDFTFYDASVDVSVDSSDTAEIRRVISPPDKSVNALSVYRWHAHVSQHQGRLGDPQGDRHKQPPDESVLI